MKEQKDTTMYFIYSEDGKVYYDMKIGLKDLSYFLNRQQWRVANDLKSIKRKRKLENKLIKNKQGIKFQILDQDDMIRRGDKDAK